MPPRALVALLALIVCVPAHGQTRWVVDVVRAGDPANEREHDWSGRATMAGTADGVPFRRLTPDGWARYSLRTYDDTPVAVVVTVRRTHEPAAIVVDVNGRPMGSHIFAEGTTAVLTHEFAVPVDWTRGLSKITVTIRSAKGTSPELVEVTTLQEHLE